MDVSLSIRMHRFSPLFKSINVNRQILFLGFYPIAKTPVNVRGERIEVWDFRGEHTLMVGLPLTGGASETELAKEISEWFELVWKDLSEVVVEI